MKSPPFPSLLTQHRAASHVRFEASHLVLCLEFHQGKLVAWEARMVTHGYARPGWQSCHRHWRQLGLGTRHCQSQSFNSGSTRRRCLIVIRKALLEKKAKVYIACRNVGKAQAAIDELEKETGRRASSLKLDLLDLGSVEECAREFLR